MSKFVIADPPHEREDIATDVLPMTESNPTFRAGARLCNFPTNKETIRSEHAKWVSDNLVPIFQGSPDCAIDLTGHASRLGAAISNSPLSERRIAAIQGLIESKALGTNVNLVFQKSDPRGESQAEEDFVADGDNSGRYRAVEVLAFAAKQPPKIIIPKLKPVGTTHFKIRMVVGSGAGLPGAVSDAIKKALALGKTAAKFIPIPVTADFILFEIVEDTPGSARSLTAKFFFVGGGFGLSQGIPTSKSPPPGGASVSFTGPFTPFRTFNPVFLPTFAGEASVGQPPQFTIGGGPLSVNSNVQLTMESRALVAAKANIIPRHIKIETGPGFGITLFSVTKGSLFIVSPPTRFFGP